MGSTHDTVKYSLLGDRDRDTAAPGEEEEPPSEYVRVVTGGGSRPTSSGPSTANMFAGRLRGSQRITFLAVLLTAFLIIIWLLSQMDSDPETSKTELAYPAEVTANGQATTFSKPAAGSVFSSELRTSVKPDGSTKASDFRVDPNTVEDLKSCFSSDQSQGRSISDVYKKLQLLNSSTVEECKGIWNIFDRMLRIDEVEAPLVLPEPFQKTVKGWLDNNEKLFETVNHQVVYKIVNKGTFEETVINPIRSKRPQSKPSQDPMTYIQELSESSRPTCDFCRYQNHTAEDTFGRIDNKLSASCSNTFKLAKFHGLFFPKQHFPLNLTLAQLEDLFLLTSQQWFVKAHNKDRTQRFPSLLWDTLPHAGASQVHPHIHGILDPKQYVGRFESWHQVSLQYFQKFKRSYWSDFVKVHLALGLGITKGRAVVITPLPARKDHEFMIIAPSLDDDVVSLINSVLQTYLNRLGVYCFSSAGVYPKLDDDDGGALDAAGMPVVFRFGSRGTCSAVGSDVSSLELYSINNINSDLSKTFNGLMEEIAKS